VCVCVCVCVSVFVCFGVRVRALHVRVYIRLCFMNVTLFLTHEYGVTTISRLLEIIFVI